MQQQKRKLHNTIKELLSVGVDNTQFEIAIDRGYFIFLLLGFKAVCRLDGRELVLDQNGNAT